MVSLSEAASLIVAGLALIGFMYAVWRDAGRKKEVSQLSIATKALREIVSRQQEHLGLKKEEMAWKQLEGIAKALGWAYDRGFFDEYDDEYD